MINLFSDKDLGVVDIGQRGPKGITAINVQFIQAGGHPDRMGVEGGGDRAVRPLVVLNDSTLI